MVVVSSSTEATARAAADNVLRNDVAITTTTNASNIATVALSTKAITDNYATLESSVTNLYTTSYANTSAVASVALSTKAIIDNYNVLEATATNLYYQGYLNSLSSTSTNIRLSRLEVSTAALMAVDSILQTNISNSSSTEATARIVSILAVGVTTGTLKSNADVVASTVPYIWSEALTKEYTIVLGTFCETNDEGFEFSRSSYNIIDIRARRIDTNATAMAISFKRINGNDLGNGALSIPANDIQSNIVASTNTVAQDMGVRLKILTGRSDQPVAVTIRYRKQNGQGQ